MELEINNIPSKSKNVTEKDREIINRALFSLTSVLCKLHPLGWRGNKTYAFLFS